YCLFFFQAEDGIRYFHVTGVQTCALPIFGAVEANRKAGRVADVVNLGRVAHRRSPSVLLSLPSGYNTTPRPTGMSSGVRGRGLRGRRTRRRARCTPSS